MTTGDILRRFGPKVGKDGIGHTAQVYDVAVSPDGTRLLSASADQNVLLWDLETGALLGEYKGHGSPVRTVAFSPAGTLAVSGGDNGSVIIWDMQII